ncbi:MAG: hypothetical protein DSM106950_37875 [Stigonema ocellatum SAG 48.90 = DSM 106950]|nr:hypothetical protein [Stigonema ocellatum SAG 48.90 = DSM 106950]
MPSWIVPQLRNAAPLFLIILLGILIQKWWLPYLSSTAIEPGKQTANPISLATTPTSSSFYLNTVQLRRIVES